MAPESQFSQRAIEVARELLLDLDEELSAEGASGLPLRFRLDGSEEVLARREAERWIMESVDEGHPEVRCYIESLGPIEVIANLAAFEDPDSQYHP